MSSFVGHALAGATIHFSGQRGSDPSARWGLFLLIALAVAPDLDYLARWLWGLDFHPRISHSLACCLLLSGAVWLGCKPLPHRGLHPPSLMAMSLATCSHLILDLAVGVHGLPLLWPLPHAEIRSPLALLPSAGRLRIDNFYLWRNLLIETGVLVPIYTLCLALANKSPGRRSPAMPPGSSRSGHSLPPGPYASTDHGRQHLFAGRLCTGGAKADDSSGKIG